MVRYRELSHDGTFPVSDFVIVSSASWPPSRSTIALSSSSSSDFCRQQDLGSTVGENFNVSQLSTHGARPYAEVLHGFRGCVELFA